MYTRTQLRRSGNVEKSDENQETQSITMAKKKSGQNMFVSVLHPHN